jgi:hypothetical protein
MGITVRMWTYRLLGALSRGRVAGHLSFLVYRGRYDASDS